MKLKDVKLGMKVIIFDQSYGWGDIKPGTIGTVEVINKDEIRLIIPEYSNSFYWRCRAKDIKPQDSYPWSINELRGKVKMINKTIDNIIDEKITAKLQNTHMASKSWVQSVLAEKLRDYEEFVDHAQHKLSHQGIVTKLATLEKQTKKLFAITDELKKIDSTNNNDFYTEFARIVYEKYDITKEMLEKVKKAIHYMEYYKAVIQNEKEKEEKKLPRPGQLIYVWDNSYPFQYNYVRKFHNFNEIGQVLTVCGESWKHWSFIPEEDIK